MAMEQLQAQEIFGIMFNLTTRDVLSCMQVSRYLQSVLSDKYFWKKYIHHRFALSSTEEYDGPLYQWANPDIWFCYFDNDEEEAYVVRPYPTMWKCGVVVPFGLDHVPPNIKYLQGLSRALEILVHMKQGINTFHFACGNQCSPNEGCNDISVVLFPWDQPGFPDATTLLTEIFHFHPEVSSNPQTKDYTEKLYFHLTEADHDTKEQPCLNQVFGLSGYWETEYKGRLSDLHARQTECLSWLQHVMVPARRIITGEMKLNPVVEFLITSLAPGWAGGALTGQTWT